PYVVERRIILSSRDFEDVQPYRDQRTSEPVVRFRCNAEGARRFAQATSENVGRQFAIVLDNEIISIPIIREPIVGGQGQVSGDFTDRSANEVAILLRAGPLPVKLGVTGRRPAS